MLAHYALRNKIKAWMLVETEDFRKDVEWILERTVMIFWQKKKFRKRFHESTKVSASARISDDSQMGKYCYVGNYSDITKATIGNYVSIANNVSIGSGEHHLTNISTSSLFYDDPYEELTQGDCILGGDAWVGVDAIIRRGVSIGIGAVIGANSFVNADVPDFGIVVGSPARLIGFRFSEEQRATILKSKWWEEDLERAREIIKQLKEDVL